MPGTPNSFAPTIKSGRLAGKRACVTGGSRGIGLAIAERFRREGANVVTCGRGDRPEALSQDIGWIKADLRRPEGILGFRDDVMALIGAPDILVNNAGIRIEKTVVTSSYDDWDAVVGLNAKSVFACCRAILPALVGRGGGAILNIGSIAGLQAEPSMALYNASKAFVHGLTRSIAVDHGRDGIRCNAVCPGWIATGMTDAPFIRTQDRDAAWAQARARPPVGRFGTPENVAAAALWLASDEAAFVSGQMLIVDGGLTAASPARPDLF